MNQLIPPVEPTDPPPYSPTAPPTDSLAPPVRRLTGEQPPTVVEPPANGAAIVRPATDEHLGRPKLAHASGAVERMRLEGVWLAYGDRWVVRDVSLPVRKGEVLALIGASGSGKTTLLRSLNRLTEVTAGAQRAGRITLDGEEVGSIEVNSAEKARVDGFPAAESFSDECASRTWHMRFARSTRREADADGTRASS